MKVKKLSEICEYGKGKVAVSDISVNTYISTENMQPNKAGITKASSLPVVDTVQKVMPGDVLVSNIRPYFKKIWFVTEMCGCSNDVLVFRAKDGIYPLFLYYILADDNFFDYATASAKGTKMPRGDKSAIMQYRVHAFDIVDQKKIGDFLYQLDQKIQVNEQINRNLSEQADAFYKSWFVDFDPFEGKKPADWSDGTVDDLASEIVCGKTPSTKKEEYYGDDVPFVTIPDMHGCVYTVHTERKLSAVGVDSQRKKTLPMNSICVSCIGTAGLVTLLPEPSQTNQQINSIVPKTNYSPYYIYLLMSTMEEKINKLGQAGSTIVNLNKMQFGKMEVTIPSVSAMADFDEIVEPIFKEILSNQIENIRLANLRDSLIPKFMSGELDISDLEI